MLRYTALLTLLLLAGCAGSRPPEDPGPVVDVRAIEAERDSLRAVAASQRDELSVMSDSVVRLRRSNDILAGRRRAPGTPPGGTTTASNTTGRNDPPARTTPSNPPPRDPSPPLRDNPTVPDLPPQAFADTLTADDLFLPASATLSAMGQAILERIAFELSRMTVAGPVRVEGHADNTPPGPTIRERWPTNWELSSARAAAVIRFLVEQGVPETRFELVSYAATRPVAPNDTPHNRAMNRRVIIVAR
ncbi:MAG TPA: OmpA family protein [Rhodothermales bacterium]|nr:OmpA family protein [Rhodothermales bacterium]